MKTHLQKPTKETKERKLSPVFVPFLYFCQYPFLRVRQPSCALSKSSLQTSGLFSAESDSLYA